MSMTTEEEFAFAFLARVREWIAENYYPQDIYSDEELKEWAEKHGYVKEYS